MSQKKMVLAALLLTAAAMAGLYWRFHKTILGPENRVVVLGFDGIDPTLSERWMNEGRLPNLKRLRDEGSYAPLGTTHPAESPVSWSSFLTGANPGKTNIFDFLTRNPDTYMPDLSLAEFKEGKFLWNLLPVKRPRVVSRRKGVPFWEIASDWHVPLTVLRAPISFPAKNFGGGHLLCGLGVPDLRGTWGTFAYYSTAERSVADTEMGGKIIPILLDGDRVRTRIIGPRNRLLINEKKKIRDEAKKARRELTEEEQEILEKDEDLTVLLAFRTEGEEKISIEVQGQSQDLSEGQWSDWFDLKFAVTPIVKVAGMARFYIKRLSPEIEVYLSPINLHPANSPFAISAPRSYAKDLYKKHGPYKTLGWETDTWALNEERIDENVFLQDLYYSMNQNRDMLMGQLDRGRDWLTVALFYETDRVQHMFWRLLDKNHPMYDAKQAQLFGGAILDAYEKMDEIVGDVMKRLPEKATLIVVSDHGFHSFRYSVNLNTWLVEKGYLALKNDDPTRDRRLDDLFGGGSFWENVDWGKTKAYGIGLGGIYLNLRGREASGAVNPGEDEDAVAEQLVADLMEMKDPYTRERIMKAVYRTRDIYSGEYAKNAPDIEVGLADDYRVSWQSTLGQITKKIVEPNMKKWSGDHCSFDSAELGGVFFSNKKMRAKNITIMDIAPTVLQILEIDVPKEMDGVSLIAGDGGEN